MKNLLSKLCTLLVVALIIAGGLITIWLVGTIGGIAKNDDGIGGTIIFAVFGLGFIAAIVYFLIRKPKVAYSEKETSRQDLLKENTYNEIKKKHSV